MSEKRWCFTLNNPTIEESAELAEWCDSAYVKYAVYGDEVGDEGVSVMGTCVTC